MNIKARLLKLENLQPQQMKFKPMPLCVFYGKDIPESDWPEYDTIPTFSEFKADQHKAIEDAL